MINKTDAIQDHSKVRTATHVWGSFGSHLPGQSSTLWYTARAAAVLCCRDTNRCPWNRNSNRAGLVLPSERMVRSY
jgi:hypothetical protein